MHAAEPKSTATNAIQKKQQPFFNKSEGSLFQGSLGEHETFFAPQKVHQNTNTHSVQTKLKVGSANDAYEKEADAMADTVMQKLMDSSPVHAERTIHNTSAAPPLQTKC